MRRRAAGSLACTIEDRTIEDRTNKIAPPNRFMRSALFLVRDNAGDAWKEIAAYGSAFAAMNSTPASGHPRVWNWIAALAAMFAACLSIYYRMFTGISQYDDDGYLLISVRSLLEGHRLYDDVFTQYGPFYYVVNWILYTAGIPVSHDSERLIAVALWMLAALLWARAAYLLTGSLLWCGAGFLLSVKLLGYFHWSAGHPEELCTVLLAAIGACVCGFRETGNRRKILLGCLVAALAMTKVNIGLFAAIAVGLLFLKISVPLPGRRSLGLALGCAACLLPIALMWSIWRFDWVQAYGFAATVAIAATVLVNARSQPVPCIDGRFLLVFVLAMLICAVLIVVPFFAAGTTPGAMLYLSVMQHAGSAAKWYVPVLRGNLAIMAAVGSLLTLTLLFLSGRPGLRLLGSPSFSRWWIIGMKACVGMVGLFGLIRPTRMIFNLCIPFAWLILVMPLDTDRRTRIGRIGMGYLVALTYLYAFPVAGAQLDFACVPAAILALVLMRDAMLEIGALLQGERLVAKIAPVFAVLLLAVLFAREFSSAKTTYFDEVPLAMPGATRIRVDREIAARYRWITTHLTSCHGLYSMPGQFSLNFWTSQPSPTALNVAHWFTFFTPSQQQRVIEDLSKYPDMCLVKSPWLVDFWRRGQDLSQSPLARYIEREFVTVADSGSDMVLKRRPPATSAIPRP